MTDDDAAVLSNFLRTLAEGIDSGRVVIKFHALEIDAVEIEGKKYKGPDRRLTLSYSRTDA